MAIALCIAKMTSNYDHNKLYSLIIMCCLEAPSEAKALNTFKLFKAAMTRKVTEQREILRSKFPNIDLIEDLEKAKEIAADKDANASKTKKEADEAAKVAEEAKKVAKKATKAAEEAKKATKAAEEATEEAEEATKAAEKATETSSIAKMAARTAADEAADAKKKVVEATLAVGIVNGEMTSLDMRLGKALSELKLLKQHFATVQEQVLNVLLDNFSYKHQGLSQAVSGELQIMYRDLRARVINQRSSYMFSTLSRVPPQIYILTGLEHLYYTANDHFNYDSIVEAMRMYDTQRNDIEIITAEHDAYIKDVSEFIITLTKRLEEETKLYNIAESGLNKVTTLVELYKKEVSKLTERIEQVTKLEEQHEKGTSKPTGRAPNVSPELARLKLLLEEVLKKINAQQLDIDKYTKTLSDLHDKIYGGVNVSSGNYVTPEKYIELGGVSVQKHSKNKIELLVFATESRTNDDATNKLGIIGSCRELQSYLKNLIIEKNKFVEEANREINGMVEPFSKHLVEHQVSNNLANLSKEEIDMLVSIFNTVASEALTSVALLVELYERNLPKLDNPNGSAIKPRQAFTGIVIKAEQDNSISSLVRLVQEVEDATPFNIRDHHNALTSLSKMLMTKVN